MESAPHGATQANEVNHSNPEHLLAHLPFVPLAFITWLEGKSLRPLLTELFDLSPSRLRRGKSWELRESTKRRAIESAKQRCQQNAAKNGWNAAEIDARQQSIPSFLAGASRPYTDFIYGLEYLGCWKLPLTMAFAEEVDKLVIKLLAAREANNLESFKQTIIECDWGEGEPGSITYQQEAAQCMETFRTAPNWIAALTAARSFFDNMLLLLLAALDAEYGSTRFGRFQPRPLFLLVTPKINPKFSLDSLDKSPRRNLVNRPVRRLLELSHALTVWVKEQRWPNKPVGRKELGEALGLDDQVVGNFFDGTRKMNAKLFETLWLKMCETVAMCEPFAPPTPLLLAAISWQNALMAQHPNQKLKRVTLINEANYSRFWTWHRQRWVSQLSQGTEGWPAWLDDQPLPPSGT